MNNKKPYWVEYTNAKNPIIKYFKNIREATEWARNEGDHVWDFGPVIEKDKK